MEEFIYYFATAKARHYAHTPNTAVKTLHKAIFEQPEVLEIFLDDDELIPGFLVKEISLKIREGLRNLKRDIPLTPRSIRCHYLSVYSGPVSRSIGLGVGRSDCPILVSLINTV